jgi:hypothetical protein
MRKLFSFDKSNMNFKSGRTFDFIGLNGNKIADNLKKVIFNPKLLFVSVRTDRTIFKILVNRVECQKIPECIPFRRCVTHTSFKTVSFRSNGVPVLVVHTEWLVKTIVVI